MKNTILLTSSVLLGCLPARAQNQEKPNIIFIYADDLGYGDLSCYGSKINRTPNLDKLASDGIRFTDFYSASSISSPSRAGLMTGRHPIRMGIHGVFFSGSYTGMPQNEITMANALQEAGYYTGIVGKWHLGHMPEYRPLQRGFHEYFGIPYSNDMNPSIYMENNEAGNRVVNQDSITYNYTQRAVRFIEENKERPFFLYLAHNMPHVPLGASPAFKGRSPHGLYSDVIEELDWGIGEVLNKLDELGLDENTIVIFSSDNGPWLTEGPHGGKATPLFQGKGTSWEGGQRVPAIIRWKKEIKPGQVHTDMACMLDWFPTLVNIGGGKVPTDRIIDGEDISLVLTGKGKRANQDFAYIEFGNVLAYRSGDWKMIVPEEVRKGNFWVEDVPAHGTVLYNLKTDISEQHDVRDQHPEVVEMLTQKMEAFKETLKDCPPPLFVMEWYTERFTSQQRQILIEEARKNGVQAKSDGPSY
ncbi:MAG: sulfatase [Tannerellaceae bacterium]|nr:sulfatase [Tannerellaceae bacterium]